MYWREFKTAPIIQGGWTDEYGKVESRGTNHFIFLSDILVSNGAERDIIATIIHEMLHALYPNDDEKEIRKIEDWICDKGNIGRDEILATVRCCGA